MIDGVSDRTGPPNDGTFSALVVTDGGGGGIAECCCCSSSSAVCTACHRRPKVVPALLRCGCGCGCCCFWCDAATAAAVAAAVERCGGESLRRRRGGELTIASWSPPPTPLLPLLLRGESTAVAVFGKVRGEVGGAVVGRGVYGVDARHHPKPVHHQRLGSRRAGGEGRDGAGGGGDAAAADAAMDARRPSHLRVRRFLHGTAATVAVLLKLPLLLLLLLVFHGRALGWYCCMPTPCRLAASDAGRARLLPLPVIGGGDVMSMSRPAVWHER